MTCAALVGLLAFLPAGTWAGEVGEPRHVTAVRFWSLGEVTRIAVETDGDFRVRSDRLEDPERIFFDLSGTRPNLGSKTMTVRCPGTESAELKIDPLPSNHPPCAAIVVGVTDLNPKCE